MRIAIAMTILWLAIAAELAWSDSVPHGALLLPITCGILFWMRSVPGILLSAAALLIDWIARPGFLPLCPMLMPILAVCLMSPSTKTDDYSSRRQSLWKKLTPLYLPLLTMLAVSLQLIGQLNLSEIPAWADLHSVIKTTLPSLLMISLPISAAISMVMRLADELGLRRTSQNWI